jgi:hypothetical protein
VPNNFSSGLKLASNRKYIPHKNDSITCHIDIETTQAIEKTETSLTNNGHVKETIKRVISPLKMIANRGTDLFQPEQVKNYIANKTSEKDPKISVSNGYKNNLVQAYRYFCEYNNIEYTSVFYQNEPKVPVIPNTENINKIINCSTQKFIPIFTILKETGIEGKELESIPSKQIDTENGILSVQGHKRHNSGTYTLKQTTKELLNIFLNKYSYSPQYPFPKSKTMGERWRDAREIAIKKFNQPELKKIPLKNLRNYAGAQNYYQFHDPIETKRFLRHKCLEQTMHYLEGIPRATEENFTYKVANTIEEACDLLAQGFKEASIYAQGTPNEKHIFTKPK